MRHHHRGSSLAQGLWLHVELNLVQLRQGILEGLGECLLVILRQLFLLLVTLHDEFIHYVAIHTGEAALLELLLKEVAHRRV